MLSCWIMLIVSIKGWNVVKAEPVPILERQSFPTASASDYQTYKSCDNCYPESTALQSSTTWVGNDPATLPITDSQSPQASTTWMGGLTATSESQVSSFSTTSVQEVSVIPTDASGTQTSVSGSFSASSDGITVVQATNNPSLASIIATSYTSSVATIFSLNSQVTPSPSFISMDSSTIATAQSTNVPYTSPVVTTWNGVSTSVELSLGSGSSVPATIPTQSAEMTLTKSDFQSTTTSTLQTAQPQASLGASELTVGTNVASTGIRTLSKSSYTAMDSIGATLSPSTAPGVSTSSTDSISPSTVLSTIGITSAPATNSAGVTVMTCLLPLNTPSQNPSASIVSSGGSTIRQSSLGTSSTVVATRTSSTPFTPSTTVASGGSQGGSSILATSSFLGGIIFAAALNL